MVINNENLKKLKTIGNNIEQCACLLHYEPHNHSDPPNVRQVMRDTHLGNLQKNLQAMSELLQIKLPESKILNSNDTLGDLTEKIHTKARWLNFSLHVPSSNVPGIALAMSKTYFNVLWSRVQQLQNLSDQAKTLATSATSESIPETVAPNTAKSDLP